MSAASRLKALVQPGRRRFLLPIGLGVVVLALLGFWLFSALAPSFPCASSGVPSGTSGTECVSGVTYSYATYSMPGAGQSVSHEFHGVTFLLTNYAVGSLVVNGTEPGGFQFDVDPSSGIVVGGWMTSISPDHSFGAQFQNPSSSTVRLLVSQ